MNSPAEEQEVLAGSRSGEGEKEGGKEGVFYDTICFNIVQQLSSQGMRSSCVRQPRAAQLPVACRDFNRL